MARRMFSDEITTSDAFLDMPAESQNLYFHIGMGADDDGFISNTKMVQRAVNASDDALKLLFVKKFLIQFPNGICVVKHWRINNYIRKDIYVETKYTKEKSSLFIRKNGAYTLNPNDAIPVPRGHFTLEKIEENSTSTLRLRGVDIGKVRIGKVSKDRAESSPSYLKEIPDTDLEIFYNRFDCDKRAIKSKGEDLFNYCKAKGKSYRDYKAFLLNALKKDFPERKEKPNNKRVEIIDGKAVLVEG